MKRSRRLQQCGFYIGIVALLVFPLCTMAQTDTSGSGEKPAVQLGHQLRFGFDLSRPVINITSETRNSYEGAVDYYWKNEVYGVVEAGFGSANYDYPDLSYKSNSAFFRLGLDKTLIKRLGPHDWDAVFIGVRYGASFINRQEATYRIEDSVWGTSTGTIPAKTFTAHWAEITGGIKVELVRNLFVGWNVRGRFLLNERAFRELSPVYIAGYGKGDKGTIFDFSFYLGYALRWGRR